MTDVIVVVHADSGMPKVFKNKTAMKKWMREEGLQFQTWIYEGKKETSEFKLEAKTQDCESKQWNVTSDVEVE